MKKIKNFKLPKHIILLYLFIPLILCSMRKLSSENDIWFLLNHGKYVLNHGIPTIEPFTIHQNFSFIMQQWLSSVIFYLFYSKLGRYGIWICLELVTCIIMYFLYKLCMELTDNKFNLSILLTVLTTTLLMMQIVPRPQIFTYLILVIILYIMEKFYNNADSKCIYVLPFVSLLEINLHASMWFMMYIFMLPYIVSLLYEGCKYKKKNNVLKLFGVMTLMAVFGLVNPYGLNAITYVLNSYGNYYINIVVTEMWSVQLNNTSNLYSFNLFIVIIIASVISVYIYNEKRKNIHMKNIFLLYGVIFLGLSNIRNYGLLIIGTIPFIAPIIKEFFVFDSEDKKIGFFGYVSYVLLFIIIIVSFNINNSNFTSPLEQGVNTILKTTKVKNVRAYTGYNNGPYVEFRGIKTYLDTRAEVFTKKMNHKEDVFKEYFYLCEGYIKYEDFVKKYDFTHMIISKRERIYYNAIKDANYKIIYRGKDYVILEKK